MSAPGTRGEGALPHRTQPRLLPPEPHAGSSVSQPSLVASRLVLGSRPISREQNANNAECPIVSPSTLASEPLSSTSSSSISHQLGTNTHSPSRDWSNSPTMSRPTYARASLPTPSNATNIASWFGSTGSYISRERDDNCSGPLHREYSSSSSLD